MSASIQAEVDSLNAEYKNYIDGLQARWLAQNQVRSTNVYETMRPEERAGVHQKITLWHDYITPLAERWWRKRGYGVIWPDDNSKPMQVYKLK